MWQEQAACASVPVDVFFAEDATQAKQVCAECPVKAECLEANMGERFGIFGGTTPEERYDQGGANNPLPEDWELDTRGCVVDEGVPEQKTEQAPARTEDREQLRQDCVILYAEGLSLKMVGRVLGMGHESVRHMLVTAGVELRKMGTGKTTEDHLRAAIQKLSPERAEEAEHRRAEAEDAQRETDRLIRGKVLRLYGTGMGVKAVAVEVGVYHERVSRILKDAGKMRGRGAPKKADRVRVRKSNSEIQALRPKMVALYKTGKGCPQVADELGVAVTTVERAIRKAGVGRTPQEVYSRRVADSEVNRLIAKHIRSSEGETLTDIANRLGVHREKVRRVKIAMEKGTI